MNKKLKEDILIFLFLQILRIPMPFKWTIGIQKWLYNTARQRRGLPTISQGMDRLKCIGNAIVPAVAQIFLKEIYNQITQ